MIADAWSVFLNSGEHYATVLFIGVVCAYLGLFCVLRGIVFLGVALAQLAAAGVAGAFVVADALPPALGESVRSTGASLSGVGLAALGSFGLAAKPHGSRIPADARVGLVYAGSAALAVLLVWRSSRGLAELRNLLAGDVVVARHEDLIPLWIGLSAVVVVHALFWRPFLQVSQDPEFAQALGLPVRRLQWLLLGSLAVAIALSLRAGGLLLVFGFLVLPPVCGLCLGQRVRGVLGYTLAAACSGGLLGYLAASAADLPVAASVGTALLVLAGAAQLGKAHPLALGALRAGFALGAVCALFAMPLVLCWDHEPHPPHLRGDHPTPEEEATHDHAPRDLGHADPAGPEGEARPSLEVLLRALSEAPDPARRVAAVEALAAHAAPLEARLPGLLGASLDDDPAVASSATAALLRVGASPEGAAQLRRATVADEALTRLAASRALVRGGHAEAVDGLLALLDSEDLPLLYGDAVGAELRRLPRAPAEAASPRDWRVWWAEARGAIRWDAASGSFVYSSE
ncbi:MAG: metal ABC transporter permease [Planctomycetes bacterium]|nr:metal ABC transporter permease [Planctomycetota bacterium]